jgi:quinoprotein glucose dehydrogenase
MCFRPFSGRFSQGRLVLFLSLALAPGVLAQHSANNPAELAMKKFQLAPGFKIDLFAAEPQLMNPVSFSIDEQGRIFVVETHRYGISIFDITQNQPWLTNDLSFRSVANRETFLSKTFATNLSLMTRDSELIRLVQDRAGTGHADTSSVYAEGFNKITSGVAAGILARHGEVWAACIPDFWHLKGVDAAGGAESREILASGFGVHIGVTGHDLHGLRMGPDGKIYMSSGDRGFVVRTKEGKLLNYPDTGGVLRCNPDGSDLEVVCIGLRNPQELAFDQYGNLFTDDNDTAGEDRSRVIYIVEGADYGWRCSYQHMTGFGPWNKEKVWMGNIDDALPYCGYVSQGPSGLTYYPGTGLPEKYDNHFLVCDFPGGVRSFALKPNSASFEAIDNEKFLWNLWPTDVDFAPDSSVFVSDWVEGWQMPNKGRLYRIYDPTRINRPAVLEVKKLLAEGMAHKSPEELGALLEHRDMRVRLEAQYTLASLGWSALSTLEKIGKLETNRLARIHALWALGQIYQNYSSRPATDEPIAPSFLIRALADSNAEIRAQGIQTFARGCKGRDEACAATLIKYLDDPSPRVRFFAAMALGKIGTSANTGRIIDFLRANADQDAYLTHAGVMALLGIADSKAIDRAARDKSSAVRRAALLCYRRLGSREIIQFFKDPEPRLVIETARAVNDVPINDAMPELATMLSPEHRALWQPEVIQREWNADMRVGKSTNSTAESGWRHVLPYEQLLLRAINANFRLGHPDNADALADFASRPDSPEAMRVAALDALGHWAKPDAIDRVMGLWRPLLSREISVAQNAVQRHVSQLLTASHEPVLLAAIQCVAKLDLVAMSPKLFEMFQKPGTAPAVRAELLHALADLKDSHLEQAVKLAVGDSSNALRREGINVLAELDLPQAPKLLEKMAKNEKDLRLRQAAFAALGKLKNPAADEVLRKFLAQLSAGKVQPQVQLDLLEAAAQRTNAAVETALNAYKAKAPKNDEFAGYREVLFGGDAALGEKIFTERAGVECTRCHSIHGKGGVVGPDLAGIGKRQSREYLLESILYPNKVIAPGFENVTLVLKNGDELAGTVKSENADELILNSAEDGTTQKISKNQIAKRQRGLSAMPEGLVNMLSKPDLRDLIEFLASL